MPSRPVHFIPFADGAVLFREGTRRLAWLNATSAFIWCLLTEDEAAPSLIDAYAARYRLDPASARRDVEAAMEQFRRDGLLGDAWPDAGPIEAETSEGAGTGAKAEHYPEPARWAVKQRFETQNEFIEFRCSDRQLGEWFCEAMAPLRTSRGGPPRTHLAVVSHTGEPSYDIVLNGHCQVTAAPAETVLSHLFALVFFRTCSALSHKLLFHAAAVGRDGTAVLLPGESGFGKTTLAATLATRGWQFFTDELVPLDRETLTLAPLPLPMSIKPGALDPLLPAYPQLASAPVHTRADGKRVRYLRPPAGSLVDPAQAIPIRAIVFPRFEAHATTRLGALDGMPALRRLAAAGSSDRQLQCEDVEAMVALVESSVCWELVLSDLDEGIALLEEALLPELTGRLAAADR